MMSEGEALSRQLHIVFEKPERRFVPGDEIRGEVVVVVEKDTRCKGLTVSHQWQTHGKGNRASGSPESITLFEGDWQRGEYRYPFSFIANNWPFTYHGDYLNVDWYIKATADVPWAFDPSTEEEFLLRWPSTGVSQSEVSQALVAASFKRDLIQANRGTYLGVGGIGAVVVGSGMLALGFAIDAFGLMIFAGILYIAAIALIVAMIRIKMASGKIGEVQLSLEPSPAYPGAAMTARMAFAPQSDAQINNITATISGEEVVVRGSGTNRTTYRNTIHEETVVMHQGGLVPAGQPVDITATFMLGEDAPLSFDATDNDLNWNIKYHIDIARWPDWSENKSFIVKPPPAKQSQGW